MDVMNDKCSNIFQCAASSTCLFCLALIREWGCYGRDITTRVITHSVALCTCMAWCHRKDMSNWNILSKCPGMFFSPCRGWSNFLCADHSNNCTNRREWPRGGTGTDCCQSQRQFASLSVSAGDSSSPVWPAAMVITNGKSKQTKDCIALPQEDEEVDTEEKLSSTWGWEKCLIKLLLLSYYKLLLVVIL